MAPRILFTQVFLAAFTGLPGASSEVATIPFQLAGKLIVIKARVNDLEGYYILDTGSEHPVLSRRFFEAKPGEEFVLGVNEQEVAAAPVRIDLRLSTWTWSDVYAEVTDLRILEQHTGLPIAGCLGSSLFQDCELVIDFVFRELTLYRLDRSGRRLTDLSYHSNPSDRVRFSRKGPLPVIEATDGEGTLRLGIDTGAGINIWDERRVRRSYAQLDLTENLRIGSFGHQSGSLAAGRLDGLKVGSQVCPPMKTAVASLKEFNRYLSGPRLDGLLGFEFLSQYRTAINFVRGEVLLWDPEEVYRQYLALRQELPLNPVYFPDSP